MSNGFDLFIYLDEGLVKNLSSLLLNGYIEIRTSRTIVDRALTGRLQLENRQQVFEEHRYVKDVRDGYKGKNNSDADTCQNSFENERGIEQRDYERVEEEIKTIYGIFTFHNEMINNLYSSKMLSEIQENHIIQNKINIGQYVELTGEITTISIVDYIDILIDILNCYGTETLNNLLEGKNLGRLNFTCILSMLKHLKGLLTSNGTQDLIVIKGETVVLLTVNIKFFMNNDAYIYDKVQCPCKIMGKALKVTENISLLRKTAQYEYYEKLLISFQPFMKVLQDDGIIVPEMPVLRVKGKILEVAPISICV